MNEEQKCEMITLKPSDLITYLRTLKITSENIGNIRRSLFMPFDHPWNGLVRDWTAQSENVQTDEKLSQCDDASIPKPDDKPSEPSKEGDAL